MDSVSLEGNHVHLEPLAESHLEGLVRAAAVDPTLYQWSFVPQDREAMAAYIASAEGDRAKGTAVPFAIVNKQSGEVVGSTRFFLIEHWAWPPQSERYGQPFVDGCEIGYTWLAANAIRSAINTEAKLLLLTHAFENWRTLRVCFHTDVRNQRSGAALARLGARLEGVLRSHRLATDYVARDSLRYSILAAEWPDVKNNLSARLRPNQ